MWIIQTQNNEASTVLDFLKRSNLMCKETNNQWKGKNKEYAMNYIYSNLSKNNTIADRWIWISPFCSYLKNLS